MAQVSRSKATYLDERFMLDGGIQSLINEPNSRPLTQLQPYCVEVTGAPDNSSP